MNSHVNSHRRSEGARLALVASLLLAAMPAFAGPVPQARQGQQESVRSVGMLPPQARPQGYSLPDIAKITAAFNVSDHSGTNIPLPTAVDGSGKLQMLYTTPTNTFHVSQGTSFYVPIQVVDDSPPVVGAFPDINDRNAVLTYYYSTQQLGLQYAVITIDGQAFSLDERYIAAASVAPRPEGGGTRYTVIAAYLKPLQKGTHTVEISDSLTGAAILHVCQDFGIPCPLPLGFTFSIAYTVVVH